MTTHNFESPTQEHPSIERLPVEGCLHEDGPIIDIREAKLPRVINLISKLGFLTGIPLAGAPTKIER